MAVEQRTVRQEKSIKVGIVLAFTGHYEAVRILKRFLELMGLDVVSSELTTPKIIEAGTTLSGSDLCLPLRPGVGHVYRLLKSTLILITSWRLTYTVPMQEAPLVPSIAIRAAWRFVLWAVRSYLKQHVRANGPKSRICYGEAIPNRGDALFSHARHPRLR